MIGLVDRYSRRQLIEYFIEDFERPIVSPLPEDLAELCSPKILLPTEIEWTPLSREVFCHLTPGQSSRVLAYEFGFAPPKSFSIAAMLGLPQTADLIRMHSETVADAVCFLRQNFVTRGSRKPGCGQKRVDRPIFRFNHFWNRAREPQLHEHVVVISRGEEGSLDGRLLYQLQSALDCVYLESLFVQLRRAGYGVIEKGKRWELKDIDPELMRNFSSRSAEASEKEWDPARRRMMLLRGRRQLGPKPSWQDMAKVFQGWIDLASGRSVTPIKCAVPSSNPPPEAQALSLDELFRHNSIQSCLELVVSLMRSSYGGFQTPRELLGRLQESLGRAGQTGELVSSFDRGPKFCHRCVFLKEERVLRMFREGLGKGNTIPLPDCPARLKVLQKALAAPNRLRIVEMTPENLNEAFLLLGDHFPIPYSIIPDFSAQGILDAVGPSSRFDQLLLARKVPKPFGGSSFRSELLSMMVADKRPIRLQRGRVSISVLGFGRQPAQDVYQTLRAGLGTSVIIALGTLDETAAVQRNLKAWAALSNARKVPIDHIQPWVSSGERDLLVGAFLVGLHQSRVIRHGSRWQVSQVDDLCVHLQSVSGRRKSIRWLALEGVRDKVEFVREREVSWPSGVSARVLRSYSSGQTRVKAGEWHELEWVTKDGMLAFQSRNGLAPGFRLVEPLVVTMEPEVRFVERLLVWHESGSAAEILRHRPTRSMIIFTEFPAVLKKEIGLELQRQRGISKKASKKPPLSRVGRECWRDLLGQSKEPSPKQGLQRGGARGAPSGSGDGPAMN